MAYVGYTATPFANLLTSPWPREEELGDTLYPADFIASIEPPDEYLGPRHFFKNDQADSEDSVDPRTLLVNVEDGEEGEEDPDDEQTIVSHLLREDIVADGPYRRVHRTLAEAVGDFLISGIVRKIRGQGNKHHTMLINTSHLNDEQEVIRAKVEELIDYWRECLHYSPTDTDAKPVRELLKSRFNLMKRNMTGEKPSWGMLSISSTQATSDHYIDSLAEVASINYQTGEKLEYLEKASEGLRIIAIGGNRLSRGLTLEGLTVSYFIRSSGNYDTLLQMGRWFGYRPGYGDLVRVHMSGRLINWFEHLSDVESQIRGDIARFDQGEEKKTPMDLAVRIRTHPTMQVSGRIRAEDTVVIRSGYDGEILRTSRLSQIGSDRKSNISLGSKLLSKLSKLESKDAHGIRLWKDGVKTNEVLSFISRYKTSEDQLGTFNSNDVSKYIDEMTGKGELKNWSVGVHIPGKNRSDELELGGMTIGTINRGPSKGTPQIGILEHTFEILGVDLDGYPDSVTDDDGKWNKDEMWRLRGVDQPLLLIYMIDKRSRDVSGKPLFTDQSQHGLAVYWSCLSRAKHHP